MRREANAPADEDEQPLRLFLSEIKDESESFTNAVKMTAMQRFQSNDEYRKYSHESFNAMYKVRGKPVQDQYRMVPRLSRPQTANTKPKKIPKRRRPDPDQFEFDVRITNNDRWPLRNVTNMSQRVLSPTRLKDYPDTRRRKDLACVCGCPIRTGV